MNEITFYQVLNENSEVLGSYETYDAALRNKSDKDTLRYFDGSIWIYNVSDEVKE